MAKQITTIDAPLPSSKKGSGNPRMTRAQKKNKLLLESVKSIFAFLPSGGRASGPAAAAAGTGEVGTSVSATPPSSGYASESPDA